MIPALGRVEAFSGWMKFQCYGENSGEIEPAINLWLLLNVERVTKQKCYCCCSFNLDFTGTNPTRCEFVSFITKAGMEHSAIQVHGSDNVTGGIAASSG